jgi:hypothetical protein
MPTQKRRVIYLTDEQWADLQAQARGERTTISNLIRHGMALIPKTDHADESPVEFHAPKPIGRVTSITEDASGLRIEAERFNRRPFTPVPKHR